MYGSPVELVVYHQWLASRLTEGFGVDPDRLHVLPLALDAHRRTSPRPVDGTVLFFGSLRRNKGLDVLLAALNILDREDVRCVIAGAADDATYQRLRAAVASSSSEIRLELGHVTDERKWELFDAASVVVLPYTAFESQSGVLADAYAARRPVVVTDVGALGDAVRQDGTGVVVTPRDPRALADGLREVLSGPSARYRDALDAGGLTLDDALVRTGVRTEDDARAAVTQMLSLDEPPTALFTARRGQRVYYPEPALCTDNGAMIAFAGALRLQAGARGSRAARVAVKPRWPLDTLRAPEA